MGRLRVLLAAILALSVFDDGASAQTGTHTVESGDMLSTLAVRFEVSVDDLREWNHLSGDHIEVGQELIIAAAAVSSQPPRQAREHTVVSGDSLSSLATRYETTVEQIQEWNELEGEQIRRGQELIVGYVSPRARRRPPSGPTHRVEAGETLSHIAVAHDMNVEQILEMNPGLDPTRLSVGQEVQVAQSDGRQRISVRVRRGDSLGRIARRHRVRVRDIRRWNRSVRRRGLRAGQQLVLWSEIPESTSESHGEPWDGSLTHAVQLARHPSYVIRDRGRAWGTLETTLWIEDAFDAVRDQFPRSPRVRVHDISRRRGGRMHGHRSHQSGRDVDISYYQRRCPQDTGCRMVPLRPAHLDAERQWALFEAWLRAGRAEKIFVDYSLQGVLYDAARRDGYSRSQLSRWFQYPRGQNFPHGVIRHFPKHRDHAHVRFVCPDTDAECED